MKSEKLIAKSVREIKPSGIRKFFDISDKGIQSLEGIFQNLQISLFIFWGIACSQIFTVP